MSEPASYLQPYLAAARVHGGNFESLLWASQETQYARFEAMCGLVSFAGRNVLDVGCGRGDLLVFLNATGRAPKEYIGIEAVPELAAEAEGRGARVFRKDFVAEPACMFTCSDVVAISGALNTADDEVFHRTIRRGWDACAHDLVFNFLSSRELAGTSYLFHRPTDAVERFCRNVLGVTPRVARPYLRGDATFHLHKPLT